MVAILKKSMAMGSSLIALTTVVVLGLYWQQNYTVSLSNKVAVATKLETFEQPEIFPLINQASPFAKIPTQNNTPKGDMSSDNIAAPIVPGLPTPNGNAAERINAPYVKSVIIGENNANIAIMGDGSNEVLVEYGENTKWGEVVSITESGVVIGDRTYEFKN